MGGCVPPIFNKMNIKASIAGGFDIGGFSIRLVVWQATFKSPRTSVRGVPGWNERKSVFIQQFYFAPQREAFNDMMRLFAVWARGWIGSAISTVLRLQIDPILFIDATTANRPAEIFQDRVHRHHCYHLLFSYFPNHLLYILYMGSRFYVNRFIIFIHLKKENRQDFPVCPLLLF